ncbi:MAG: hypothetical protein RL318_3099 [Fibrobacterota bacterium]
MRKSAVLPVLLLTSFSALAANYRGTLEDLLGHPLRGGKVLLAKAGYATSTTVDGAWQFGAGTNRIGSRGIFSVRDVSGHLVVEQGRLRLDLGELMLPGSR